MTASPAWPQPRPWMAFALSVCMLSLLGFPGTFGFIGKWYILSALVAEGQIILAVVLVLTSVISAGYYLPVIMAMYMKRGAGAPDAHARRAALARPRRGSRLRVSVVAVARCSALLAQRRRWTIAMPKRGHADSDRAVPVAARRP